MHFSMIKSSFYCCPSFLRDRWIRPAAKEKCSAAIWVPDKARVACASGTTHANRSGAGHASIQQMKCHRHLQQLKAGIKTGDSFIATKMRSDRIFRNRAFTFWMKFYSPQFANRYCILHVIMSFFFLEFFSNPPGNLFLVQGVAHKNKPLEHRGVLAVICFQLYCSVQNYTWIYKVFLEKSFK